jgi:hypothetical protein
MELAPDLQPRSLVSRSAALIAKTASNKGRRSAWLAVDGRTRQITREETAGSALDYTREAASGTTT